jgi:hypothetical protein
MRKKISIVAATVAALCLGLHPASASLIGTPLNLKVAIELRNVVAPAAACQLYTDDVFTGPLRVRGC